VNVRAVFFISVGLLSWTVAAQAAGVCNAAFMHDQGVLSMSGTGNLSLGADLVFSEVSRTDGANCRARVKGVATFSYAGLPPSKSRLDYLLTVRNGKASFVRYAAAGEKPQAGNQFDLRMLGLFAYDGAIKTGQKLPGASFRLNIGKEAMAGGAPPSTVVRIGDKTVGSKKMLDTVLGQQACWPVSYTRNSDPVMATFRGITLPIPGINSMVTDWFCPAVSLVMQQDIDQNGVKSSVRITQIK